MSRSRDAEVSVKLPPVELERVIVTLPGLTANVSTTEPDFTVKLIAGALRDAVVSELKVTGAAAWAIFAHRNPAKLTSTPVVTNPRIPRHKSIDFDTGMMLLSAATHPHATLQQRCSLYLRSWDCTP